MRIMRTDAIVNRSPNNGNNNGPFSPLFENQRLPKPTGSYLSSMGPYSSEATKSALDSLGC